MSNKKIQKKITSALWYVAETFPSNSPWQVKLIGELIFHFWGSQQSQFLVCKLHSQSHDPANNVSYHQILRSTLHVSFIFMPCVKIDLLPPGDCLMYAILSKCVGSTSFHFFSLLLLKLLAAKDDQEYSQLLMEDDWFDILCQTGYRGLPTKEKVSSRESVVRYAIKVFVFNNFAWQWEG